MTNGAAYHEQVFNSETLNLSPTTPCAQKVEDLCSCTNYAKHATSFSVSSSDTCIAKRDAHRLDRAKHLEQNVCICCGLQASMAGNPSH